MTTRKSAHSTGAVIYLRVSTDEQAKSGLGLEAQETRCRAWAEANGLEVVAVLVDDGVSAKTLKRPALENALALLQPGRVLIAYKLDRLTRTIADFPVLDARIKAVGGDWATVEEKFDTSTAMGRAVLSFVLTLSQLEREQTGERTSAALQAKKARGERLGAVPFGFDLGEDGSLTPNAHEQAAISFARGMKANGHSLRVIGAALMREGYRCKRGGTWGPSMVSRIIAA